MGEYEEDWSDRAEGWASGLGLAADAIGLGTAATGFGAPVGAIIAGVGNVPNIVIDAYQAVRDWNRAIKNNRDYKSALWNTGELGLDLLGAKLALKGAKIVNDRAFANEVRGRIEDEVRKRQGQRFLLRKKGMTDAEIEQYILQKSTNAAVNTKDIADARKRNKEKQARDSRIIGHTISATQNGGHVVYEVKPDALRVQPRLNRLSLETINRR